MGSCAAPSAKGDDKFITTDYLQQCPRSESYLCAMKAGACRYDTEGYVTEHISQEEEVYAAERLDKIRRQNRIKAELQAVLDEQ